MDQTMYLTIIEDLLTDIQHQKAEIERLKAGLVRIRDASNYYAQTPCRKEILKYAHQTTRNLAEAALKGEGDD